MSTQPNVCVFGASPDTGNQGVTALHRSLVSGLAANGLRRVTVFDYGRGRRVTRTTVRDGEVILEHHGAMHTRRYYRPESHWMIGAAVRTGLRRHPAARAILEADAILDASAGDSFADLYGSRRFESVVFPKRLALRCGTPLFLLPQTYGPFRSERSRRRAERIVRGAEMCWARDERSFAVLRELAGDAFDPERHRRGVDMAFLLPSERPSIMPPRLERWLAERETRPVVGFNVSGLIYNDPAYATRQFELRTDYRRAVLDFTRTLLRESDTRLVLVPHVLTPPDQAESDVRAAESIRIELGSMAADRIVVVPPNYSPAELKWVIGGTSWFCGTRMHSTIAGLSSGVPTVALSYSIKTAGVFETCGMGESVLELRELPAATVVDRLLAAWRDRRSLGEQLRETLPAVKAAAVGQMREIVERVVACRREKERSRAK